MHVTCPKCGWEKESVNTTGATICPKCRKRWVYSWPLRNAYRKKELQNNPQLREKARLITLRWSRRNRERINASDRAEYAFYAKALREHFGNKCTICGKIREKERFELHEKNGENHLIKPRYEYKHMDRFVLLCKQCHRAVHWAMKYLHLSWYQMFG